MATMVYIFLLLIQNLLSSPHTIPNSSTEWNHSTEPSKGQWSQWNSSATAAVQQIIPPIHVVYIILVPIDGLSFLYMWQTSCCIIITHYWFCITFVLSYSFAFVLCTFVFVLLYYILTCCLIM